MNAIELIKNYPDAIMGKGVSNREIEEAEKTLHLKFAEDYKEYLHTFGAVMIDGHELSGISKAKQMDVVSLTQEFRKTNNKVELDIYVLENMRIDNIVICQDTQGTIYEIQNQHYKKIMRSLTEYIEDIVS